MKRLIYAYARSRYRRKLIIVAGILDYRALQVRVYICCENLLSNCSVETWLVYITVVLVFSVFADRGVCEIRQCFVD